ncbi:MAG: NAD(P)H-dependent oxidoreductase [Sphingobacterium sp.]|uniref:NAD(P)H-dependent oxidoreductase n=1 Tax=Sphingobacterium sp. JB170 TaxID=1434842 RepID=UPI00097F4E44|nr:NAD(P)H-dependent oxidoreductase [Sphingobacterium sp. JB170]SJN49651.1 Oxygen-insensitive NAD(P)H nitroreductase / Dihydropteridine reductase [Sphingobacterium sp. JB170]
MSLLQDLNWRYATKKMNGESVPQEKVDYILEAARLAPTSSGLQPFKVIEITSPELKAKIQPIAFGQSQIVDASHLLVFAAYDEYTKERVDSVFIQQELERALPKGFADDYKNNLFSSFQQKTKDEHFEHSARQAYIGFGLSIAAAAEQKVDATPMEGFNNAQLDELLGLPAQGLKSVTILALGYRDTENDWLVSMKKVRIAKQDFVIQLN